MTSSANLSNLRMLQFIALKLGEICNEVVFLGGCTIGLFITDSATPDIRSTLDVDCIVDVVSITQYYKLEKKLQSRGFKKELNDEIICRWYLDDAILDVMPADSKILGFGNIKHNKIKLLVLCGHTHSEALYNPLPNLVVRAGKSEYYLPQISDVIEI